MMTTSNSFIDCKLLLASKILPTAEFHRFIWTQKKNSHLKNVCGTTNKFLNIKSYKKKKKIIIIIINVQFTLKQATKTQRGSRGIALLFL